MIERCVEIYQESHAGKINIAFHVLGFLFCYLGILSLFWSIPNGIIVQWLGDNPYANWATVFTVIMIFFYGSESFNLTFVSGIILPCLLWVITQIIQYGINLLFIGGGFLVVAFTLFIVGHIFDRNISFKELGSDIKYLLFMPAWFYKVITGNVGISL